MPINYPTSLDSLANPTSTTNRDDPGFEHHIQHSDANDAIEALETKLGVGASDPAAAGGGNRLTVTTDGSTAYLPDPGYPLNLNGSFEIDQQVGPFTDSGSRNNDDSYTLDQWTLLSDGNDIVDVSQETATADIPTGAKAAMKLLVATANKKFAVVTFLEARDAAAIIGGQASVAFKARTKSGNPIANIRAALLSWSSTADSITSDVVSAWGSAGTNPTWAANWTAENTAANLALTDTWQQFKIENVNIDTASAANVALVIWCDDTDAAVGDELWLAEVGIYRGAVAPTAYPYRPVALEQRLCERQYQKSFATATAPAQNAGINGAIIWFSQTASSLSVGVRWPTRMRGAPTVTTYNPSASNSNWRDTSNSADRNAGVSESTDTGARFTLSSAAATSLNLIHYVADARL